LPAGQIELDSCRFSRSAYHQRSQAADLHLILSLESIE
jgi:hypothetical protein